MAGGLQERLKMSWRKGKGEEKSDENGKNVRDRGVCPRMRAQDSGANLEFNFHSPGVMSV